VRRDAKPADAAINRLASRGSTLIFTTSTKPPSLAQFGDVNEGGEVEGRAIDVVRPKHW